MACSTATDEDRSISSGLRLLRGAAASILVDDTFTIPTEAAMKCLQLARSMVAKLGKDSEMFAEWLYSSLAKVVQDAELKKKDKLNKDKLWREFHKLRSSESFAGQWKLFMQQLQLNPLPLFYQHVTQEVFECILTQRFSCTKSTDVEKEVPRLTDEEENAVRYVGGYVIRSIKEKLKRPKDEDVISILNNLKKADQQNCLSTSEKWVEAVDRGGLVKITDSAFQCFYSIEYGLRRHLQIKAASEMDDSSRSRIVDSVVTDDDVQFYWCLTGEMDEDAGNYCLNLIVEKYVTVRGFSFAKSIMELYKQKSKKGTEKSKSLRTKLFT